MKFSILHECRGQLSIHIKRNRMSMALADMLEARLSEKPGFAKVKVYDLTRDAVILYEGERKGIIAALLDFDPDGEDLAEFSPEKSARALNREYTGRLLGLVARRYIKKFFFPAPLRMAINIITAVRFIYKGLRCLLRRKLEVEVLDALSISASLLRGDFNTAGSVMFLLKLGELLEEWTRKKSAGDLARSLSLNVDKVWLVTDSGDICVPVSQARPGDVVRVRSGGVIPLDGTVFSGEASVNQASLTGESIPVLKEAGSTVYAGTVVEEGECEITVSQQAGSGRYDRIVDMIERSEKLKSGLETRALALADKLVPYSLAGTAITYLLTRNVTRAVSILMVDYSCALKLSMPLAVLSAMRECGSRGITVKGGKYLEAVSKADTIVFDKTGTLTHAEPTVTKIVPFGGYSEEHVLRVAACLEEHFPHSMANAVVKKAREEGITHDEMHTEVEYIVAHGISSLIDGERAIIGSHHFVFGDEGCRLPRGAKTKFRSLPPECSHLFLAIGGSLAGVICVFDPLREEAPEVLRALKDLGIKKTVMMTGDNERTAAAVAERLGVDEYFSEVLPEDKAKFVEREKAEGKTVIMVGDGINDSPALSAADAGIAISDGAAIAREIADITIAADDLWQLVTLRKIADGLQKRTRGNYRFVIGFNSALIILGAAGVLPPTTSALLHNASTLGVSLKSMTNILK